MESLQRLKHTGTLREYGKQFSSFLLDIKDMLEEDKLFNFMTRSQNWAQLELHCLGVKNLSAIAVTNGLLDYKLGKPSTLESNKTFEQKGKDKKGDKKGSENKSGWKNGKDNSSKFKLKANDSQNKNSQENKGCFIYDGPHKAKDCPKRETLNAIVDDGSREGSDSD